VVGRHNGTVASIVGLVGLPQPGAVAARKIEGGFLKDRPIVRENLDGMDLNAIGYTRHSYSSIKGAIKDQLEFLTSGSFHGERDDDANEKAADVGPDGHATIDLGAECAEAA
jgi:hypothetical protein